MARSIQIQWLSDLGCLLLKGESYALLFDFMYLKTDSKAAMFEYTCTPASKKKGKVKGNKRMGSTE